MDRLSLREDPEPADHAPETSGPTSFDSRRVNAVAVPVVAGLSILFTLSPLGFMMEGFHVWIHEVGHASVAWLSGHPAVPLPIGWTNVEHDKSLLFYSGVLLLLVALGFTGWRERRLWPMVLSAILIGAQGYMTWILPEDQAHLWMIFGGVGGEFWVAASMVALFYFEFPDKFKWGACRYAVLFIGAGSFYKSYALWRLILRGEEGIPYGSMINGEDDGGGDMNILKDDYGWTQHHIIHAYAHLANGCLVAVGVVYLIFSLGLDRMLDPILGKLFSAGLETADEA